MAQFLVFQSDFGLVDGAVSAMKGVAYGVSPDLILGDVTHDIAPYNVFEASYRLYQTAEYWPSGTVFVSVVDPGVGSNRKSVAAKLKSGQYIVTPNNGTLTHLAAFVGIEELREIEERTNRLQDSEKSYTFHGRDVYAYAGARLASGAITFEEMGPELDLSELVLLKLGEVKRTEKSVTGQIDILDVRFGSLWTGIPFDDFKALGASFGDTVDVMICNNGAPAYKNIVTYGRCFADVPVSMPVLYMNSVNHMALAINQGSFAKAFAIGTGPTWTVTLTVL